MENSTRMSRVVMVLIVTSFLGGSTCSEDDGIPTNACAVVRCKANTTCIAVPDPFTCQPTPHLDITSCPQTAMCIPTGVQLEYGETPGIYCGTDGEKCGPGYKCDLVYPFCPISVNPCLPMLACVPVDHLEKSL